MICKENEKITFSKNDLITIIGMFIAGCLVIGTGLCLWGHTPPMITEFIYDFTLGDGSNPYIENRLFWGVIFAGLAFLTARHFLKKGDEIALAAEKEFSFAEVRVGIIAMVCLFSKIYGKDFSQTLIFFFIVSVVCLLLEKERQDLFFFNFLVLFFASLALEYMHTKAGTRILFALVFSFLANCTLFCLIKRNQILNRILLVLQCVIPLCLLVYLKNTYIYGDETITIPSTLQLKFFLYGTITILIFVAIFHAIKNWKNENCETENLISISTCIVVAGISTYSSEGLFVPDNHHLGEMVISFNQIFDHHLVPYKNFYPVSGGFPIILGGILRALGLKLTGGNIAIAVYCFAVAMLTVILLTKYIQKQYVVFLALFSKFATSYARPNLILLFALILFLPKLREKKNWWFLTWVILIYISVFNYPLYGFATFVGILPLGIFQIVNFIKQKEYKTCSNDKAFLFAFSAEVILLLISIPSIIGVVTQTIANSSGNLMANAWPVFGRDEPAWFLSWIPYEQIRRVVWWAFRYMFPVLFIWIPAQITLLLLKGKKESFEKSTNLNIAFFCTASLMVSVSYTIVRQDYQILLCRTDGVLFPTTAVLLGILIFNYLKKNIPSMLILGTIFFLGFCASNNIMNNVEGIFQKKLGVNTSHYAYITKEKSDEYNFLGEGFIPKYMADNLPRCKERAEKILAIDPNVGILGFSLGEIVALNVKTPCQPSMGTAQSYKSVALLVKSARKEKPVILHGGSYNFQRWLLTTDEYIFNAEYWAFFPKDFALEHNLRSDDKLYSVGFATEMGKVPAMAGKALNTISKAYIENPVATKIGEVAISKNDAGINYAEFSVQFEKELFGKDSYCLYFDIDRTNGDKADPDWIKLKLKKQVNEGVYAKFSWQGKTDKSFMKCEFSDGRLFVPLGFNADWLLGEHDEIIVKIEGLDMNEGVIVNECKILGVKEFVK